jgi:hypothetical protein
MPYTNQKLKTNNRQSFVRGLNPLNYQLQNKGYLHTKPPTNHIRIICKKFWDNTNNLETRSGIHLDHRLHKNPN